MHHAVIVKLKSGYNLIKSRELLPLATKLGQGYIFTGVCHSVNRGGVCLSACWDAMSPGKQTPLGRRHPPRGRPPRKQTSPQKHMPPEADTPPGSRPHLEADTHQKQTSPRSTSPGSRPPQRQTPPGSRHPQKQTPPRSRHPPGSRPPWKVDNPRCTKHAGRYGQRAGGSHPTGMQSCIIFNLLSKNTFLSGKKYFSRLTCER